MWILILAAVLSVGCVAGVPASGHFVYDHTVANAPDSDLQRANARCVERYGAEPDLTGRAYGDWFTRTEACMRMQGWVFVEEP